MPRGPDGQVQVWVEECGGCSGEGTACRPVGQQNAPCVCGQGGALGWAGRGPTLSTDVRQEAVRVVLARGGCSCEAVSLPTLCRPPGAAWGRGFSPGHQDVGTSHPCCHALQRRLPLVLGGHLWFSFASLTFVLWGCTPTPAGGRRWGEVPVHSSQSRPQGGGRARLPEGLHYRKGPDPWSRSF